MMVDPPSSAYRAWPGICDSLRISSACFLQQHQHQESSTFVVSLLIHDFALGVLHCSVYVSQEVMSHDASWAVPPGAWLQLVSLHVLTFLQLEVGRHGKWGL